MRPEGQDKAALWDMIVSARSIVDGTRASTFEQYQEDRLLRKGIEREIEIIGEAAGRLSDKFRLAHPEVPWREMIAQRNKLIHEYWDIDDDRIWRLITAEIPRLVDLLQPLAPELPPEPE